MMSFTSGSSSDRTSQFLKKMSKGDIYQVMKTLADKGVVALEKATPRDSGTTAGSWYAKVVNKKNNHQIFWCNDHVVNGAPVVILLQYGHGTGTGGYVQGKDFINPAIKPIFDEIAAAVWKGVTSA